MRITEKQTREVDVLVDVKCDVCGESCASDRVHLSVHWGYSSRKDCMYHEVDICETCYDNLPFVKVGQVRIYDYTYGYQPVNEAAQKCPCAEVDRA